MQRLWIVFVCSLKFLSCQEGLEHIQGNLRLIGRNHVASIDDLQKGQTVACTGHARSRTPVMTLSLVEFVRVIPDQFLGPSLVAKIVANEIHVARINQCRESCIQQIRHKMSKVLHPIDVKFHVDSKVAGLPRMRVVFVDAQGLLRRFHVEPFLDIAKIITQRSNLALLANIIGIQARGLVGRGQGHVAGDKGRLAGKAVNGAVAGIALMNQFGTGGDSRFHGVIDALIDDLDAMRVVPDHFGIPWILMFGSCEPIANGQSGKVQFDAIVAQLVVSLPDTVRNGRNVVSPIGFTNNVQRIINILGMGLEKGLEKVVGVFAHHFFAAVVLVSVRKSDSRRLVQPQNVGSFRPRIRIDFCAGAILVHTAGTIFRQQRQRAGASRSSSQPNHKRDVLVLDNVLLGIALFEHPEKQVFVPALIELGSTQIHVSTDRFARGITEFSVRRTLLRDFLSELQGLGFAKLEDVVASTSSIALKDARGEALGFFG
mmetsp:Transcript_21668/g.53756  ORF Transcript_21668/g.53756 Transcript_21668/m.53756 type:complete len:486 (+) Transcript_21668:830-2287(+)